LLSFNARELADGSECEAEIENIKTGSSFYMQGANIMINHCT
jgi:hypothetical protein